MFSIANNTPTISHFQLSELTGKRQDSVKRTIETLLSSGVISNPQIVDGIKGKNGVIPKIIFVNERDSYIVVAQLCPEYTAKLVDHWMATKNKQPQLPQTFAEALQLAADQAKQLELAAPKVAFVDKLVSKENLMNTTTVAQKHGLSAIKLNKILLEHDVYSKSIKRGKVYRQWFVDKKYGEMKQTDSGFSQAMITNAGEIWINELLIAHGYI